MWLKRFILLFSCFAFLYPGESFGQDKTLGMKAFLQQVSKNHPLVMVSTLLPQQAREELLMARGAFDPSIELGASEKEYLDKDYFTPANLRKLAKR